MISCAASPNRLISSTTRALASFRQHTRSLSALRLLPMVLGAAVMGRPASAESAMNVAAGRTVTPPAGKEPKRSVHSPCLPPSAELHRALQLEMAALGLVVQPLGDTAHVEDSLGFELMGEDPNGEAVDESTDQRVATLTLACSAQLTTLSVQLAAPDDAVTRAVNLSDIPDESRARTLAIAMTELVRTTRNAAQARTLERERARLQRLAEDLELQTHAKPETSPARDAATTQQPSSLPRGSWQVGVSGLATLIFEGNGQMLGGELSGYRWLGSNWRLALELPLVHSQVDTDFGQLNVTRWGLSAGTDWNAGNLSALFIGPRLHWVSFAALGNSRIGVPESTQSGFGVAATARVSFEIEVSDSVVVRTTLDGGATLRSMAFTAAGRRVFRYDGVQAIWGIGVAWRP